jgi:hypothetical protein
MKKIILLVFLVFLVGCNKTTEAPTTLAPTTIPPTTEITTNLITSSISDEIYLYLVPGIDTIDINQTWIDAGAYFVVNDDEFQMITSSVVNSSEVDVYSVVYSYEYEEKTYTIKRLVAVVDQTPPVLSLNPGIDTVTVGGTWLNAGIGVVENSGEDVTIVVIGRVDTNTVGTYEITYQVTDSSDNTSTIIRYVNVVE